MGIGFCGDFSTFCSDEQFAIIPTKAIKNNFFIQYHPFLCSNAYPQPVEILVLFVAFSDSKKIKSKKNFLILLFENQTQTSTMDIFLLHELSSKQFGCITHGLFQNS